MNKHLGPVVVLFAALTTAGCANNHSEHRPPAASSLSVPQLAEQQIAQVKKGLSQEAAYYSRLEAEAGGEPRDERWATQMQSKLEKSFAANTDVAPGALKSVKCQSSKCILQLDPVSTESPQKAIEQERAIDQWIAWSQPCGYVMSTDRQLEKSSKAIRIILDCSQGEVRQHGR
jgi:hypothetical protein